MRKLTLVTTLLCLSMLLSGCFSTSAPSRFYQISPTQSPPCSLNGSSAEAIIGVGPISIPSYLDRSSIVSRGIDSSVTVHDFDYWIEPLSEAFVRTLTERISAGTGTTCLTAVPWTGGRRFDYQLVSDIVRFDCSSAQRCILEARWYLQQRGRETLIPPQVFSSYLDLPETTSDREAIPVAVLGLQELANEFSEVVLMRIKGYLEEKPD